MYIYRVLYRVLNKWYLAHCIQQPIPKLRILNFIVLDLIFGFGEQKKVMFSSSHFSLLVTLGDEVMKIRKYYVICLFTFFKSLAHLALQTETIIQKITQLKWWKTKNEITKICDEPGIVLQYTTLCTPLS